MSYMYLYEVHVLMVPQAAAGVAARGGEEGDGRVAELLLIALIILAFSQIIFRARGGGIFPSSSGWKTLRAIPVRKLWRHGSFWFLLTLLFISLGPNFF